MKARNEKLKMTVTMEGLIQAGEVDTAKKEVSITTETKALITPMTREVGKRVAREIRGTAEKKNTHQKSQSHQKSIAEIIE